jgi:hypothetical protein
MSVRVFCAIIMVGSTAACGGDSGSHEANVASAGGAGTELTCPVSDSGRFEATPTGACMGTGSCAIELDNSCRPGVTVVPSTPPVYECHCASNQWQCVVKSGGLGLITCGDAGGP